MKQKIFLLLIIYIFAVQGGMSQTSQCGKTKIVEKQEISACGVKDPLKNIPWLAEKIKNNTTFTSVDLYKNSFTGENFLSFSRPNKMGYTSSVFYDCCGKEVFFFFFSTPPGNAWYEEFFGDKEFVATLWEYKK